MLTTYRTTATAAKNIDATAPLAKIPKAVTAAGDRMHSRIAAAYASTGRPGDLVTAMLAAIDNGVKPATDPDVQSAATAVALGNMHTPDAVADAAANIWAAELAPLAGDLVKSWNVALTSHAKTLTEARTTLGEVDIYEAADVLRLGAGAAEAWSTAQAALRNVDQLVKAWQSLAAALRWKRTKPWPAVRLAAVTLEQARNHPKPDPWTMAGDGITLALPDSDELARRVTALEAEGAAERAEADDRTRRMLSGRV